MHGNAAHRPRIRLAYTAPPMSSALPFELVLPRSARPFATQLSASGACASSGPFSERPPNLAMGDLASPVAFELAKTLPKGAADDRGAFRGRDRAAGRRRRSPRRGRRVPEFLLDAEARRVAPRAGTVAARRPPRKDHRRTYEHQPEQSGSHRPSPQCRARRRARPDAHVSRTPRRGAELSRRHWRTGRRRRCRAPALEGSDVGRRPAPRRGGRTAARRHIAPEGAGVPLLGRLRRRREGVRAERGGAAGAPRSFTRSRRAKTRPRASQRPCRKRSSRLTSRRWAGSDPVRPPSAGERHPSETLLEPGVRAPQGVPARSFARRAAATGAG